MRGTADLGPHCHFRDRFIPACAGNRPDRTRQIFPIPVHPRVCGEQGSTICQRTGGDGSSPRVRGTDEEEYHLAAPSRFIPACAGNRNIPSLATHSETVHPRVCGEQVDNLDQVIKSVGSSPRVRGTARRAGIRHHVIRFIPACAGNSGNHPPRVGNGPVHPRVCGEQIYSHVPEHSHCGSSPRVRGTVLELVAARDAHRFIPACAGNSLYFWGFFCDLPVHPRVCGEQGSSLAEKAPIVGSSPRVRGTVMPPVVHTLATRFIPACAGNSTRSKRPVFDGPVHPRVCGEQVTFPLHRVEKAGSSPRVRGTVHAIWADHRIARFIPACAGNRGEARGFRGSTAVHPRVCGEQLRACHDFNRPAGSSPRVRGTGRPPPRHRSGRRFIPACAGNRRLAAIYTGVVPVHPRVCGEQFLAGCCAIVFAGSSPRVRGTVTSLGFGGPGARFIPACAGNSYSGTLATVASAVHPRVCGEQAFRGPMERRSSGSSPRVRGTET